MADAKTSGEKKDQAGGASGSEELQNEPNRTATKAEGDRDIIEQDIEEKERKGEI
ncbi:MAG TPA: hypothetical protein VE262_04575 [Blastocatellia bacterium]|nr:hypothetical protein [Blastocatellia bacterium]